MPELLLNGLHGFPGLDSGRTGDAADQPPLRRFGVAQMRIGLGQWLAFHGSIIADRTLAKREPQATIRRYRIVRHEGARQEEYTE